ncbi:MAG: mechanosensitive ion channel domain-containing protein [Methylophilaceae bacterium]
MKNTTLFLISFAALLLTLTAYGDELNDITSEQAITDNAIIIDSTNVPDSKISKRLKDIFIELDDLKAISVDVKNGVITLSGIVNSSKNQNIAIKLAKQIQGVVAVESNLEVNRAIDQRLSTVLNKAQNLFDRSVEFLPVLIIAILTFILFWLLGGWISHNNTLLKKITPNQFIANLLGQVLHLIIIVLGLIMALSLLDATSLLSTILGAAGIIGLAVGFAVKDTVENYIASILLSLRNPFEFNDFIDIDGNLGNVARLTTRATILISPDGNHIRIPNAKVFKAVIVNYTRNPQRRFQFDIGVDSAQDLKVAQHIALKTISSIEGILQEPKPQAFIQELGDFNVVIRFFCWVDQANFDFGKVRSEAIRLCKLGFDQANIVMPEPIYQIRMNDSVSESNLSSNKHVSSIKSKTKSQSDIIDNGYLEDLTPDDSVEIKAREELHSAKGENLLNDNAPKE